MKTTMDADLSSNSWLVYTQCNDLMMLQAEIISRLRYKVQKLYYALFGTSIVLIVLACHDTYIICTASWQNCEFVCTVKQLTSFVMGS